MLSAQQLLDDARASSGLQDYGDMRFADGLRVLIDSMNREAGLTPANEARMRGELLRLLENRLRMQRDLAQHPEILDEEILAPVFITSLPRTGSTKLHRMLAASGAFNPLKFWQAYHFSPLSEPASAPRGDAPANGPDPRIAATEQYLAWLRRRAPLYMEGHPMYADETEEEHILLDAGFNSLYQHAAFMNVPSYVQWVMGLDRHAMFEDLRRMLQYLQWQHYRGMTRRWILKTPGLLGTEATLAEVFPGTDFIVTHRDPASVMPSVAALCYGTLQMYNENVDPKLAGRMMLANFGHTVQGHLAWRAQYPADKVIDIAFDEIVGDEMAVLAKVFGFLRLPLTETHRENVKHWLAMDAARREPSRKYAGEEFGLSDEAVNATFAAYRARYKEFVAVK